MANKIKNTTVKQGFIETKVKSSSFVNNGVVPNSSTQETNIHIDLSLYRPFSIKTSFFTNYYANKQDYIKKMQSFYNILIKCSTMKKTDLLTCENHSHKLEKQKSSLLNTIIKQYEIDFSSLNLDFENFYQVGFTGSLRIVGVFDTKDGVTYFYPLFSDPHHLIYPDIKHNTKDTHKYSYNNVNNSVTTNFNIIDHETLLTDTCFECEHLIKELNK